jgi:uncharacterized protein YmfQ (DUF2313 family)
MLPAFLQVLLHPEPPAAHKEATAKMAAAVEDVEATAAHLLKREAALQEHEQQLTEWEEVLKSREADLPSWEGRLAEVAAWEDWKI